MKRILIICLALLWLLPGTALAHSKLTDAVPAQDAVIDASPEQIELTFNTKIEKLSNLKLFNAAGEQVETEKASVDGATMTGKIAAPLVNGEYTVKWTIIGADGHAIDGSYTFAVNAPEAETPTAEEPTPIPTETPAETPQEDSGSDDPSSSAGEPAPNTDQNAPDDSNTDESAPADKDKTGLSNTSVIIIGVALVALILVLTLRRKK